jgi:ribonuclease Z
MKFTILGAGPGLPHPDYNLSGIVVSNDKHNFLLDCGEGISKQLLRHGFDKNYLDAILISHYHPDHVTGIYMLIQMLYLQNRKKPLHIFLPERSQAFLDSLHMYYTFEERLPFEIKTFDMLNVQGIYPEITIAVNDHLDGYKPFMNKHGYPNAMLSYSISITNNGKKLLYTSDLNSFDKIEKLINSSNVILVDALHPEAMLIANLSVDKSKHIILTHGISEALQKWMNANKPDNMEFAVEDKEYLV